MHTNFQAADQAQCLPQQYQFIDMTGHYTNQRVECNDWRDLGSYMYNASLLHSPSSLHHHFYTESVPNIPPTLHAQWVGCHGKNNIFRCPSPDDSQASTMSEVSTPTATTVTPGLIDIRCSKRLTNDLIPATFSNTDNGYGTQSMPWAAADAQCFMFIDPPARQPLPIPQSSVPPKLFELDDHIAMDFISEGEEDLVHVSMQREPEEVVYSAATTVSSVSSASQNASEASSVQAWSHYQGSDDETDEDKYCGDVKDDGDSDFILGARRRRPSRTTSKRGRKASKRRCKSSSHSVKTDDARVTKKPTSSFTSTTPNHSRRPSKPKQKGPVFASKPITEVQTTNVFERVFPCAFHHFGCPAMFPNKNEWKRHVACQHLKLGYFRCDLGACKPDNKTHAVAKPASHGRRHSTSPPGKRLKLEHNPVVQSSDSDEELVHIYNDFNRKDLFTQHARRMHGPSRDPSLCSNPPTKGGVLQPTKEDESKFEQQLENIRQRCWRVRRKAPARSNCGFCDRVFDADYYKNTNPVPGEQDPEEKAWEERMEHMGRHYEKEERYKGAEEYDDDLAQWGLDNGVFYKGDDGKAWLITAPTEDRAGSPREKRGEIEHVVARPKVRRQPSRTVERTKRTVRRAAAAHDTDSDDDADGEPG